MKLPERVRHFLASNPGADVAGTGPETNVVMPFTGDVLTTFKTALASDVTSAIERARIAQTQWAKVSVKERARIIGALHHHVRRNEELLLDVIQAENGKARLHAFDEVMDAYNIIRYASLTAPEVMRERSVTGAVAGLTTTRVVREPVGVVGFISPWNYPLSLGANDVVSSLVAGNAVVHKPDSKTPLSAILFRRLAIAAGLPADLWQLVPGDVAEVSDALTGAVDGLSFTGSSAAGKKLAAHVGGRLIPTAFELGGKNPLVILPDADLDQAVDIAVRGSFSSTGQLCISFERIYVVDPEAGTGSGSGRTRDFVERFVKATSALTLGASFDFDTHVGTLTHPAQLERVSAHVEDAVAAGAVVEVGGKARPDLGPWFYEPTILTGVTEAAQLYREETFGPVVAVYSVASEDAAVEAANDTRYGLNAAVVSGDKTHGFNLAHRIDAGMVNINEAFAATMGSVGAPSGGVKDSGLGHRHGTEGIEIFTRTRTLAHQAVIPLAPFKKRVLGVTLDVPAAKFQKIMSFSLDAMRALRMK